MCIIHCGFVNRFVEYWARIGSENNMTLCHRPTCRKEGVLLDYSTDGGALITCMYKMHCVSGFYQCFFSICICPHMVLRRVLVTAA